MLADLTSGKAQRLPGDGYRPVWSTDGEQVLFASGRAMYVMRLKDGKASLVTQGIVGPVEPVGWRKDGQRVLYAALEAGFHLRERDLRRGTRKDLGLVFNNKAGYVAVSPDGQWAAFADMTGSHWGLYLARLDGSERHMLVTADLPFTFIVTWSPDGRWLAGSMMLSGQAGQPKYQPFVLNPFTCQAYILPIEGIVEGWGP
jgi:Tol biopolymer transport system component